MLKKFFEKIGKFFSSDTEGEEDEDGRFVPSELDKSVRYAHGGARQDIARELDDIEDQVEAIEEGEEYEE